MPQLLIQEYYKPDTNFFTKWAIGNTLDIIADDRILSDMMKIIDDPANGQSREMFVSALRRMKDPKVIPYLVNLLKDPDLGGFAIMALSDLKAVETRPYIEAMTDHPRTWFRNKAKSTLKKFDRILEKQKQKAMG